MILFKETWGVLSAVGMGHPFFIDIFFLSIYNSQMLF